MKFSENMIWNIFISFEIQIRFQLGVVFSVNASLLGPTCKTDPEATDTTKDNPQAAAPNTTTAII